MENPWPEVWILGSDQPKKSRQHWDTKSAHGALAVRDPGAVLGSEEVSVLLLFCCLPLGCPQPLWASLPHMDSEKLDQGGPSSSASCAMSVFRGKRLPPKVAGSLPRPVGHKALTPSLEVNLGPHYSTQPSPPGSPEVGLRQGCQPPDQGRASLQAIKSSPGAASVGTPQAAAPSDPCHQPAGHVCLSGPLRTICACSVPAVVRPGR